MRLIESALRVRMPQVTGKCGGMGRAPQDMISDIVSFSSLTSASSRRKFGLRNRAVEEYTSLTSSDKPGSLGGPGTSASPFPPPKRVPLPLAGAASAGNAHRVQSGGKSTLLHTMHATRRPVASRLGHMDVLPGTTAIEPEYRFELHVNVDGGGGEVEIADNNEAAEQ